MDYEKENVDYWQPEWLARRRSTLDAIIELWEKIPQIKYAFFGIILGEILMWISVYISMVIKNILGI